MFGRVSLFSIILVIKKEARRLVMASFLQVE